MIGFGWFLGSGRRAPRSAAVAVALALPVFVWATALQAGPPSGLVVHFFDVGQGDAALVTSPGGANVLIDGGPEPDQVATVLSALGVRRLDAIIGTHPHADHLEGLPAVMTRFPVGEVFEPGCNEPSPSYTDFLQAIRQEDLHVFHPRVGDTLTIGDLRLEVLAPNACYHGTNSDPNNDSVVFRLTYLGDTVMFPGDAEEPSQQAILDAHLPVTAEVLKVPHHGGDTSLVDFFNAVHPQLAVVSVGQPNDYGHPVPKVLDELAATGARVMRTDRAGDITVTFAAGGLTVESSGR